MQQNIFWDIESLENIFTIAFYHEQQSRLAVFILSDDESIIPSRMVMDAKIRNANKNFEGRIEFYDLHDQNVVRMLYLMMAGFRQEDFVRDVDPNYDENLHPYIFGYNSYNYDTTMLALFLCEAYDTETKTYRNVTASMMRHYNDELFTKAFKSNMPTRLRYVTSVSRTVRDESKFINNHNLIQGYNPAKEIRDRMIQSGRHIDVARLNEKQQKIGLKRALGQIGCQILESDKLKPTKSVLTSQDEVADLIAYNVSDVVNLAVLFHNKIYESSFTLKKGLLEEYPELIFNKRTDSYKPDIGNVSRQRLTIDSSSQQFASRCLCPYGHLNDAPYVSFLYPSEKKAKEKGIKQVNVLEEARKFFYDNFKQPELRAQFDRVYNAYRALEGKNFNESNEWVELYGNKGIETGSMDEFKNITIPYFNADGTENSCFINFSTGGIHGAEMNIKRYKHDLQEYQKKVSVIEYAKDYCRKSLGNPAASDNELAIQMRTLGEIPMPAGNGDEKLKWSKVLKTGSSKVQGSWKVIKPIELFDDTGKLNKKYSYTSAELCTHEDFTSYYPNLLINMSAFWNENLNYDRYAEMFQKKEDYGKLMKDKSIPEDERKRYSILRNGVKLILNSASGAGDAGFYNPVRMNNRIISMRIIGQLFTWRIGQAQTIAGARIISTNTDGLYSVLESTLNNQVLEREAKNIGVDIEPELMHLISKDSNNRMELDVDYNISSGSGGALACWGGIDLSKSLSHPAVCDWCLSYYMQQSYKKNGIIPDQFDESASIFANMPKQGVEALKMYQHVIASSPGSYTYNYAKDDNGNYRNLQHYNRIFYVKAGTPNAVHVLAANGRQPTPAMLKKRGANPPVREPEAFDILEQNGVAEEVMSTGRDIVTKKITNIDIDDYCLIINRSLYELTQFEIAWILDSLDYDKYIRLTKDSFNKNWSNSDDSES